MCLQCTEKWGMIFVKADEVSDLHHTHLCWTGVFVLEALTVFAPHLNIMGLCILSDFMRWQGP